MEEYGLDGAVGRVVGGGGRHQLGVALEEEVHLAQELVHFDGGEELGKLAGDLPETLGGRGGILLNTTADYSNIFRHHADTGGGG